MHHHLAHDLPSSCGGRSSLMTRSRGFAQDNKSPVRGHPSTAAHGRHVLAGDNRSKPAVAGDRRRALSRARRARNGASRSHCAARLVANRGGDSRNSDLAVAVSRLVYCRAEFCFCSVAFHIHIPNSSPSLRSCPQVPNVAIHWGRIARQIVCYCDIWRSGARRPLTRSSIPIRYGKPRLKVLATKSFFCVRENRDTRRSKRVRHSCNSCTGR